MYHFCLDWQNWTYSNHHKGVDFVLELLHVATLWKTCVNMHCANKGPSTRSDFSIILLRFIISLFVCDNEAKCSVSDQDQMCR